MTVPKFEISQSEAVFIVLRYQVIDLIWLRYHAHRLNLGTLRWQNRLVWFRGSIKLAWYADEEYHEGTITYKCYSNVHCRIKIDR